MWLNNSITFVGHMPILRRNSSLGVGLFLGEGSILGKDLDLETNDLILEHPQKVARKKNARGKETWKVGRKD
jgi:hypothetical protein